MSKLVIVALLALSLCGCSGESRKAVAERVGAEQDLFYAKLTGLEQKHQELFHKIERKVRGFNRVLSDEGGKPTMRNVNLGEEISFLKGEAITVLLEKCDRMKAYISELESTLGDLIDPRRDVIKQGSFVLENDNLEAVK